MKKEVKYKQKRRKQLQIREEVISPFTYSSDKDSYKIIHGDCLKFLSEKKISQKVDLTFLDPPFNQDKKCD